MFLDNPEYRPPIGMISSRLWDNPSHACLEAKAGALATVEKAIEIAQASQHGKEI